MGSEPPAASLEPSAAERSIEDCPVFQKEGRTQGQGIQNPALGTSGIGLCGRVRAYAENKSWNPVGDVGKLTR